MEFIKPMEIAAKIMTLIEEAKTSLIIVSPYVNIQKWDKMKERLRRAIERNVEIKIIVRENSNNNLDALYDLNLNIYNVKNLHAKVYLNENYGIVTSQNMIQYSDNYSIDIGYVSENKKEYNELQDYINHYLLDTQVEMSDEKIINNIESKVNSAFLMNSNDLDFIYRKFIEEFEGKITKTDSYIWSRSIVSDMEIMVNNEFTIKLYKISEYYNDKMKILKNLKLDNLNFEYTIRINEEKEKQGYFDFIPVKNGEIKDLYSDYRSIIERINIRVKKLFA